MGGWRRWQRHLIVLRRVNEAGRRARAGHNSRRRAGYGTRSRVLGRTSTPRPFLEGGEPTTTERSGSPRRGERYSCGTAPALHRLPSVWSYNSGSPSHGRWPRDDLASMATVLAVGQTPVLADQEVPPFILCHHPTGTGASDQRPTPDHVETGSVCPDRWQSRGCGGAPHGRCSRWMRVWVLRRLRRTWGDAPEARFGASCWSGGSRWVWRGGCTRRMRRPFFSRYDSASRGGETGGSVDPGA